jgi:CarD family transcriptional regulator
MPGKEVYVFRVGDKIVHPAHGAGVIAGIEQPDILDEYRRYYIIDLMGEDRRLMVPVRTAQDIGLRRVVSKRRSREMLAILSSPADGLPDDFKQRQSQLSERMREGSLASVARVVRDMAARSRAKAYSPTETRLYEQARRMLGGELALVNDTDVEVALHQIDCITGVERRPMRALAPRPVPPADSN